MDPRASDFIETFRLFLDEVVHAQRPVTLTPLGELVESFLGAELSSLPVFTEEIPAHRLVDADIAAALLAGDDAELVGVAGTGQHHEALPQLLRHPHVRFAPGPVDYVIAADGFSSERRVIGFGLRLFTFEGARVVMLQRSAAPQYGRESATIELLTSDAETAARLVGELRRLMIEHSVLRGQVLSFEGGMYGPRAAGAVFLERPEVPAEAVVLPDGVLDQVTDHVLGISRLSGELRRRGQHLKRGVLLYGPPGTGKTLTVRHLVGGAEGVTTILLTGTSIHYIGLATELARAMQPSMVVLEDIDLVASERDMHGGPQPLLFAVLDALDGLAGDADVAFVMTTNRVDVLETALAQRPGRVDLAVEVPLPDAAGRRRLFALYAAGLPLSSKALDGAADRAEGVTGSFAKELTRRVVLRAVEAGREPIDADLEAALADLLSANARLTRQLLVGGEPATEPARGRALAHHEHP